MADGKAEDKPQGPTDPQGPGGIDAPAPPGGPQRTDTPSGDKTPGDGQDEDAQDLQEENAETSLDQPSQ